MADPTPVVPEGLALSIEDDADTVFLQTQDFSENVVYKPHQGHGEAAPAEREIKAVVFRNQIATATPEGDITIHVQMVHVENDAITGISGDELDMGGDRLRYPTLDGGSSKDHTIVRLITQDQGMLVFECQ